MIVGIAKIFVIRIVGAKGRSKRPDRVDLALNAQRGRTLIEVLVRRVIVGLLVTTTDIVIHFSDFAAGFRAAGKRVERSRFDSGRAVRIAGPARGFHPEHAADRLAAVDGALRAAQDLELADVGGAGRRKDVAKRRRRITQAHAVDDDLRIVGSRATDEHRSERAGFAPSRGRDHARCGVERVAKLQDAACFELLGIEAGDARGHR